MAEGHAVVRWARALSPLVGEPLVHVEMPKRWGDRPRTLVGAHLTAVEPRGKHLLVPLSTGETLHTHAMQYGSWQVGAPGMVLRKKASYVRLRLVTHAHEAVFYHGPVVELLTAGELAAHGALLALGPDLMAPEIDRAEIFRRLAALGDRPLGDAVMDQRALAGVGNIFKSEGLFLARLDPRRPAASVSPEELGRFLDAVVPLMWKGTERFGRTVTVPPDVQATSGAAHWVYQRKGKPCLACGMRVEVLPQGDLGRKTYFCPACQR